MSIIVKSIIVMGLLSILFGILLSWFNKIFEVKKDEKVAQIYSLLAGANCGACGYGGCEAFANAIVKDGVDPTKCKVTNGENMTKILITIGKNPLSIQKLKPVLKCVANKYFEKKRAEYFGIGDCRKVIFAFNGDKSCEYGCIGLGTCEVACPFDAIKMKDGIPTFDYDKCTGCGICANICPRNVIEMVNWNEFGIVMCNSPKKGVDVRKECTRGCIKCGICIKVCPTKAISWGKDQLPVFDMSKCNLCNLCVEKCPTHVIQIQRDEVVLLINEEPKELSV